MQYKTRQRDAILSLFIKNPEVCFSARDIIESGEVRAGQATVYRTLSMLADERLITRFTSDGGDFYKLTPSDGKELHMHIVCEECGRILHIGCSFLREMERHFRSEHGFQMDTGRTVIYGRCDVCAADIVPDDKETRVVETNTERGDRYET